ncbi:MAG TPA: Gldg family protein [Pirellulales bacterium]|jgi:ABC-2 type transport system permease protein|nr:Gldg family protein [Pirellulales bacterium]
MNSHVILAVFRRNFYSYFSSPTGYVFITVFVVLCSLAAFWPNDFFIANLANLDQLNKYLPLILLVFIPAITMSIWAEERRQGTDELLLTIPAGDFDVVVGKYLAAVAIYSVSLMFSLVCNMITLAWLGHPDLGLFVATYIGHWVVGLAMVAIGMVASFLTSNLTVGFVLGVIFNIPLVALSWADVIVSGTVAPYIAHWGVADQFRDFSRGVISLGSLAYFASIIVAMLYLSMVLISRRHWAGGSNRSNLGLHYFIRTAALVVGAVGLVMLCDRSGVRADISSEHLSSLSPQTRKLIRELSPQQQVLIDAYISPEVPESYVQTRLNLLSTLREFEALGHGKVQVRIHNTEPNSEEADRAEKLYGITSRRVESRSSGAYKIDEMYLGVAFTSGLNKVVVPFFDTGIPVEYEVARSMATVSEAKRKKLGVLKTDAQLFGGFDPGSMSQTRNQLLIDELEKQYEVKQVGAEQPITEKFDVLLAVQPSSLAPEQMEHFIAAVRGGTPTAIFEDPFPYLAPNVTATSAPKQAQQNPMMGMFGGQQPPMPKGDIGKLWKLLGVNMAADRVIWQAYNPHPRFQLPKEFVFIDAGASNEPVFNEQDPISSGLQELLFVFPGAVAGLNASPLSFKPLVMTGDDTGYVLYGDALSRNFMGQPGGLNPNRRSIPTGEHYVLAAHVSGELPSEGEAAAGETKPASSKVNTVIVSDIDVLYSEFFNLRAQSGDPNRSELNWNLDNVTFVLNILDELAGDDRFVDIRKRRPAHRTLVRVDQVTEKSREQAEQDNERYLNERDQEVNKVKQQFQEIIDKLNKRKDLGAKEAIMELQLQQEVNQRRLDARTAQLTKEYERKKAETDRRLELEKQRVQRYYKRLAVLLPPILPLAIGIAVFFNRLAGEREGVARSRLR